jgi:cysteine-rich repeat protein
MMSRSLSFLGSALLVVLATACGDDGNNSGSTCGDGHVTGSESCDDGNSINGDGCSTTCQDEGLCGNGVFDVSSEQCDDGNTVSGDGCSATCDKEGTCGNGAVEAGETCDDGNTAAMDGCNSACSTEADYTCTGMPSVCTPGGGGGTCAAPTTIALTAMGADLVGTAMGDTTNATNGVPEAACDGDVAGGGKDQIYKFTTTDVRDVLIVLTPGDDFDAGIRMMSGACDTSTELIDQIGDDGCSDYAGPGGGEALGYVNLPAGTYYVSVDGWTDTDAGPYQLDITASVPSCGDGLLGGLEFCDDGNTTDGDGCTHCTPDAGYNCDTSEPSVCQAEGCGDGILQDPEECDDDNTDPNDGCDATCVVEDGYTCIGEPSVCTVVECGNGIVDGTDECDDGNPNNGDRCTTTCILEQDTMEAAEPNDTTPQTLSAGDHIIRGTFEDGDVDLYTFTLTATSKVEIETYSTINATGADYGGAGNPLFDCLTQEDDPEVAIFPAAGDPTDDMDALVIDDDDGDGLCSYLGPNDSDMDNVTADTADTTQLAALPAGTYTIRLRPSIDPLAVSVPAGTRYMLDLKIVAMGSGPVAPAAGDLKINEFLAADGGTTNGGVDTNCDGSVVESNDEFLELVNVSAKMLDLTGVTYSDGNGLKFTFAAQAHGSLTLAPGKAVVIWGGGTPQCPGVTNFFTNGTFNSLSLNDAGDTITIKGAGVNGVTIATATYASGTIGKSLNLSPDVTGTTYALHDAVAGHVGTFSPGLKVDGTAF